MVINCITLETVGEAMECIQELQAADESSSLGNRDRPACGVQVKKCGTLSYDDGRNPIYIITIQQEETQ